MAFMHVRGRKREEGYVRAGEGKSLLSACVGYVTKGWELGIFLKNWSNP